MVTPTPLLFYGCGVTGVPFRLNVGVSSILSLPGVVTDLSFEVSRLWKTSFLVNGLRDRLLYFYLDLDRPFLFSFNWRIDWGNGGFLFRDT